MTKRSLAIVSALAIGLAIPAGMAKAERLSTGGMSASMSGHSIPTGTMNPHPSVPTKPTQPSQPSAPTAPSLPSLP